MLFGDYGFDNGYFAQQNNPYQPQMQNQNYGYQSQNAGRQRQPQNFNFQQQAQTFQQPFEFPRISGFDEIKNIHVEPGQRQWFMFENDPIMGVKMLDSMGIKTYTRLFLMNEITAEEYLSKSKGSTESQDYVPVDTFKKAFTELQNGFDLKLKEMERKINKLQKGMNNNAESFERYVDTTAAESTADYADADE